jgi:hypothetical protein
MPAAKKAKRKPVRPAPVHRTKVADVSDASFVTTFNGLKRVLAAFAPRLHLTIDEPRKYYLVTKSKSWKGGPMFFAAIMQGKAYESYHLMPLYTHPELKKSISAELKNRMQGNACFNFRSPDEKLFRELSDLTKSGLEKYRAKGGL